MTAKFSAKSLTITFHFGPFVVKMRFNFVNLQYPEGYLEAQAKKEEEKKKQEKEKDQDKEARKGKGKGKRKRDEGLFEQVNNFIS